MKKHAKELTKVLYDNKHSIVTFESFGDSFEYCVSVKDDEISIRDVDSHNLVFFYALPFPNTIGTLDALTNFIEVIAWNYSPFPTIEGMV